MPLSDIQRQNEMGLWKLQYPHLSPSLDDPVKLQSMADMYFNMAQRADLRADPAAVKDFSTRALEARQALQQLYGVGSSGMTKMSFNPGAVGQVNGGLRNMLYNSDPSRTVNTGIPNVYRGPLIPEGSLDNGIPDPNNWKARI